MVSPPAASPVVESCSPSSVGGAMEVEIIEGIDPLSAVVQLDPIRFPLNASETIPPFQKPPSLNPSAAEQPRAEIKPEFRDDVSYSGSSEGTSSDVDSAAKRDTRKRVVVVGLGMVAMAFIEKLLKLDERGQEHSIIVLGEEPHVAYNRVGLTSFFEHREVERLYLNPKSWYDDQNRLGKLNYMLNTAVVSINPKTQTIEALSSPPPTATPIITSYTRPAGPIVNTIPYDTLVICTGSSAMPPLATPGHTAPGVFLYRNIVDLEGMITYSSKPYIKGSTGVVVGGGLLGLEAAKAMLDLENFGKVMIIDKNKWVLSRQLDEDAGRLVGEKIRELGVDLLSEKRVAKIETGRAEGEELENGQERVVGVEFTDGGKLDIGCICYAIGIKPRDELAQTCGLEVGERGGILVNDELQTSVPNIYAIGECASWKQKTYGLIAPGVEMADVLAFNLTQAKSHSPRAFKRPDLSTKLKLLGVDVASFGDYFADQDGPSSNFSGGRRGTAGGKSQMIKALTYRDPFAAVYKKYLFTADGKKLVGGMMIGDTKDYIKLVAMIKSGKELGVPPGEFILGSKKGDDGDDADELEDDTQICSCHNVTKGDIVQVIKDGTCKSLGEVKSCTKAGTGCAGCIPLVQSIFNCEMKKLGQEVSNHLCPHFAYSRQDLFSIIAVKKLATLAEVMSGYGKDPNSLGCEVCKPALGSIFASLHNHHVMSTPHHHLQDTNDKYLGNIQRNGTFSVVPRVAGGEITPEKLIVIGNVAKQYGLYCKITGGQRIDMFGAKKQDLVDIWTQLVAAGMESGHAYAKSLRTIKSCVGSTWCRYGIGDSVGMAVRLEHRYKSIRSPHKLKSGVSGCIRECSEAQNKDFGLIATDKGYNIFVAGNGGAKPRHGDILIRDCPPDEVIPILDRYLMFYIRTADRLQRTARWLEGLPGGINYLKEVVLNDKLGICKELEDQMSVLVSSYFCEWTEVVNDISKRAQFSQFANGVTSSSYDNGIELVPEREQFRPAYWPKGSGTEGVDFRSIVWKTPASFEKLVHSSYFSASRDANTSCGIAIKRGDTQLALFHVPGRGYFCSQNMCPSKRAFVLSDGLIGDDPASPGRLWVSCPLHKHNFELSPPHGTEHEGGTCLNDSSLGGVKMFKVEERDDGWIYAELPSVEELDGELGTEKWVVKDGEAGDGPFVEMDRKIEEERRERAKKGRKGVKVEGGCGGGGMPRREAGGKMVAVGGCGGGGVEW